MIDCSTIESLKNSMLEITNNLKRVGISFTPDGHCLGGKRFELGLSSIMDGDKNYLQIFGNYKKVGKIYYNHPLYYVDILKWSIDRELEIKSKELSLENITKSMEDGSYQFTGDPTDLVQVIAFRRLLSE